MAYDQFIRRIATGQGLSQINLGIGSVQDVTITFDNPLADTNYVVTANVFTTTSSLLNQLVVVGVLSKTITGCIIRIKNTGVTLAATQATIDVLAVRRLTV